MRWEIIYDLRKTLILFDHPEAVTLAVFEFDDAFTGQICGEGLDGSPGFVYMCSDFFLQGLRSFLQEVQHRDFFQSA